MNFFDIMLLDAVLILSPLIIYNTFLSTNKNIKCYHKKIFFSFALFTGLFLTYKYSTSVPIINFLLSSSLILIGYLKKNYITANALIITSIIIYNFYFNYLWLMLIPYGTLFFLTKLKKEKNISDFIFIDLFLLIKYIALIIWIKLFNSDFLFDFSITQLFTIILLNYLMIHIIYMLYNEGEKIINYHIDYKELQKEQSVKLSLFKITHEIKNPIAVIKAYLDMLNLNNSKQVHKYIPIIQSEINRLLTLLQDFMLVNKSNVEMDIMDINMLLEEVIRSLEPMMRHQNIKLKSDIIDDEIYIEGDYKRLGQVFINLIKNSIEAIDNNHGTIKIKNSIIENKLNIIIEDNGSGMNEETLEKIKTPFYTTKQKGTGLGVSLSDEIIKAHKGLLIYNSKEGIGTKVTVEIPLNRMEKYT